MAPLSWIALLVSFASAGPAHPAPAAGSDGSLSPFQMRRALLEPSVLRAQLPSHRERLTQLPALARNRAATSDPGPISPPNVSASDPTQDLFADTQTHVSIAAWGNDVVAIWMDAQLDSLGQYPFSFAGYAYSCDGGHTFTDGGAIPPPLYDDAINWGEVTVDGAGNFYAAINLNHGLASGNPLGYTYDVHAVWKGRFDGCAFTWQGPVEITSEPADSIRHLDIPHIAADPATGRIYVAYSRHVALRTNQMEAAYSYDGGASWSTPAVIQNPVSEVDPDDPRLAIGPNSEVYVAWTGNPHYAWLGGCDNSSLAPTDQIWFTRSTDFGQTWRSASAIAPEFPDRWMSGPGDFRGFDHQSVAIATDRSNGPNSGAIYVAWPESGQWDTPQAVTGDTIQEIEPNGLNDNPTVLGMNRIAHGTAASTSDIDFWQIDLQAGDNVLIFLQPDDWACIGVAATQFSFRTRMYPLNPRDLDPVPDTLLACSSLQQAPDRIVFSCKRSGTYLLDVQLRDPSDATNVGYTLSARRITFEAPTPFAPARDERDIVLVRSLDQGTTWSDKTLVNWDSPERYSESLPALTVDDTGLLSAFWYDHRLTEAPGAPVGLGILTDVYMAQSTDGATFSPARRVTDESSLFLGVPTFEENLSDADAAVTIGRDVEIAWADGRTSHSYTSGVDAYTDRVTRPRVVAGATSIPLGTSTEGDTVHAGMTLANRGGTPLQVSSVTLPYGNMAVTPTPPFTIPVDGAVPLRFDVTSISAADSAGTIQIGSSDPFTPNQSVAFSAQVRPLRFQIVSEEFFREPTVVEGQDIPVIVVLDDSVHVDSVSVYYRASGAAVFSEVPLEPIASSGTGVHYRAFIPNAAVGPRGLEFYVAARNGGALYESPAPASPIRFQVRVPSLTLPSLAAGVYHMISVPLAFSSDTAGTWMDMFGDNLGPTDPLQWRMYSQGPATGDAVGYRELTANDSTRARLGSACWLITSRALDLDTSPAVGVSTPDAPMTIDLPRTWNMIASPFDFPVAWADVQVDGTATGSQSIVEAPMHWNSATRSYEVADVLQPFEGYFVKRNGSGDATLTIPPQSAPESAGGTAKAMPRPMAGAVAWELTVRVADGRGSDAVRTGVAPGARSGHDTQDISHPPSTPAGEPSVAIPHPEWNDFRGLYGRDLREPLAVSASDSTAAGHEWPLMVAAGSAAVGSPWVDMELTVEGVDRLPTGIHAMLVDDVLQRPVELDAASRYRFAQSTAPSDLATPRFRLRVGTLAFLQGGARAEPTPAVTELEGAAPNPFRTNTMIRYVVAQPGRVRLAIYDAQGRRVKALASGATSPGTYEALWDGGSDRGASVGPGLYFVRFEAPGRTETHKLLKVR